MTSASAVVPFNPPASLVEFAYDKIREDIIYARLAPGEKLRIEDLRARYDLGSTPVREALSRLSSTGLVEATSQRGFRVSPISERDLDDVAMLRIRLETDALRDSIAHGGDAWEAEVAATHHTLHALERRGLSREHADFASWEERNRAFHEALISACTSPWTLRFRATMYDQHERYRRISHASASPARAGDGMREHAAIKDAALRRDSDKACALTEAHIVRTLEVIRARIRRNGFAVR